MDVLETDSRLDFIGNYVQKALKLKLEKWTRLLSVSEYRIVVFEFLENQNILILIISQVCNSCIFGRLVSTIFFCY